MPTYKIFRHTIGPLLLLLVCPFAAFTFWYTNVYLDGSFLNLFYWAKNVGVGHAFIEIVFPYLFGSATAWKIISIFAVIQLVLMKILPGKPFYGPITPTGNIPVYKANGISAFITTLLLFYISAYQLQLFSPSIIYDHFGEIIGALNLFSLIFCFILYFKGIYYPSSSDASHTGNFIFDYYWGTELYPRIFGWDVKMFTNCRFGMMSWALIIISFAHKQSELYGLSDSMLVSVCLQLLYIAKFFFWETGYLRSLDIMHDRAGYYICWGCLVWVPSIYTSPTLYLVNHPNYLGSNLALTILLLGGAFIIINFLADRQRQRVRATSGKCKVWRRDPRLIVANYITTKGENKQNVLLSSGWWGISRHFHYIPEILGALFWTLPALFDNFLPYFYVSFLTILLIDRVFRDDKRCAEKYGSDWKTHCQYVPYKLFPFVF